MERPGNYHWLLLESPSLYIYNDELLHRADQFRDWPERVYIGAGTNEGEGDVKREMVDDVKRLNKSLHTGTKTCLTIIPGAVHDEDAWRLRLPGALEFLLGNGDCGERDLEPSSSGLNLLRRPDIEHDAAIGSQARCSVVGHCQNYVRNAAIRTLCVGQLNPHRATDSSGEMVAFEVSASARFTLAKDRFIPALIRRTETTNNSAPVHRDRAIGWRPEVMAGQLRHPSISELFPIVRLRQQPDCDWPRRKV